MGGTLGNPITEADQDRINEIIQEVVKEFSVEFSKAYTQAVIAEVKETVEPPENLEDSLKLQTAPVPSHVLKSGMLTKRGESVKSWKQRFFVAYNAKDNFKIDYHDGTSEAAKLKGTIYAAGYRAYEFNAEDIAEHGEPGIKLVPWSWRRRTWYIKCSDDQERKDWLTVFENACYKAVAPRDEDACIATAFDSAIKVIRWRHWFWGWYAQAGPEPGRLAELIMDILEREVIRRVVDDIPAGPARQMTVDLIWKTISSSVNAACSSAWISSGTAVRSLSDSIKASVGELITPLLEQQKQFKDMITEKVSSTADPFLAEKAGTLLKPLFNCAFKPVLDAFVFSVQGFHSHMASKIASNEFAAARFDATLEYTNWQMDWWSGPMHKAYEKAYSLWGQELAAVASLFDGAMSAYSVYQMVMDKIKLLVHRAVFTFGSLAKSTSEGELGSVLSHVTQLMIHDALIMIESCLMEVLLGILDGSFQEFVMKPCAELVTPIQEQIEAIPIPGLPLLMDLSSMLEEVLGNIESNCVASVIKPSLADAKSTLDVTGTELGLAAATI